jgi:hypothetical protein
MEFKDRNLRAIAEMVTGDNKNFHYRSSSKITEFFNECGLPFIHDGSTRWTWTAQCLSELLNESQMTANKLPEKFINVLSVLMRKSDAVEYNLDSSIILKELNISLKREGFEAFYGEDDLLYIRHIETKMLSINASPHRSFTEEEKNKKNVLSDFLKLCSEDNLIQDILLPLFKHIGFRRVTVAGHKDKALEYGKDMWMSYVLPTHHIIYFGIQAKKGKLDTSGISKSSNSNLAEVYHQTLMMLGHEIFDPEINKKVLVDHAFIIAGGEITKQAKNWIVGRLDTSKRSQILFMDKEDILNLYVVNNIPLPKIVAQYQNEI